MNNKNIRIAITHGDINGIGYEVMLKAFSDRTILDLFTPVVYGSPRIAAYWRKVLKIEEDPWQQIASAREAREGRVNIIDVVGEDVRIEPGVPGNHSGTAALDALDAAVRDVQAGICQALVTAPINKAAMPTERFPYRGHTDYLADKCGGHEKQEALMILIAENTRVALATTHCPLAEVSNLLTPEGIVRKIEILANCLKRDFAIAGPRIAVLALNPHAGDQGLIGREEETIIRPAIALANERRHLVFGPFAADGFWGSDAPDRYDAVLAMYHDQGLAPFKALFMNEGVNYTAGLNIVRTSPDHGTAYDKAGKGIASPDSLRHAIYAAIDIYRRRTETDLARQNPLRQTYRDQGRDDERIESVIARG